MIPSWRAVFTSSSLALSLGLGCDPNKNDSASGVDTAVTTNPGEPSDTGGVDSPGPEDSGTPPPVHHQPPIQVTIDVHGHNYNLSIGPGSSSWMTQKRARFQSDKTQILWLAALAESVGGRVNFQLNGEFCRDARELDGDTAFLAELEAAGHLMGSHFHMHRFSGIAEFWVEVNKMTATETQLRQIWADQVGECEATLGHSLFRVDPALVSRAVDAAVVLADLFDEYQPGVQPAGEVFSYTDWNHKPYNPFRRAVGSKLSEDPDHPILGLMSLGQVGQLEPAGLHQVMTSVPQIKRHFLALVTEWREAELSGAPPKQWQFGVMTHPHDNIMFQSDVEEVVRWLGKWTDGSRGDGAPLVEFATDDEVLERFEAWEMVWPDASSFSFDWETHVETGGEPYPYGDDVLTMALRDTEVDSEVMVWRDQGVTVFRLFRRSVLRGTPSEIGVRPMTIGDLEEVPLFLAWSTTGETVTIDASALLGDGFESLDSQSGETSAISPGALEIPPQAVLIRGVE
jgi:hypothetical protein